MDESLKMAAALAKAGFKKAYCTPHLIRGAFDAGNRAVLAVLDEVRFRLKEENIDLELLPGREYYLDDCLLDHLKDPMPLGQTKYILVEFPNQTTIEIVKETCFKVKRSGFVPMIAHPERNRLFADSQKQRKSWFNFSSAKQKGSTSAANGDGGALLDYLTELGCAFQANLGSFAGFYGSAVEKSAECLNRQGLFTHFGTDAHSLRWIDGLADLPRDLLPIGMETIGEGLFYTDERR